MPVTPAVLTTVSLALIILAVTVEVAWLTARDGIGRIRPLPGALALGAWSFVVAPLFLGGYRILWPHLAAAAPGPLDAAVDQHPVVAAAVAFVAWDAAGFGYHWLGHRTRLGWTSHRTHHSGPAFDLTVALRQSWLPLPALVTFPLVALTGVSIELALAVAAVSNVWQALVHTAAPVPVPAWLGAVVVTPATHRLHHERGGAVNLGPVLTVWDRAAGTWQSRVSGHRYRPSPMAGRGNRDLDDTDLDDDALMALALEEAKLAPVHDDVPVGCVVVLDGRVVARRHNEREHLGDPTAHAELLAIRDAAAAAGDGWRLTGATVVVTIEPCPMCAGAIVAARAARCVFGAPSPEAGSFGSLYHLGADPRLNHEVSVTAGVRADEAAAQLGSFFAAHRPPR